MRRIFFFLILGIAFAALGGCATTDRPKDEDRVSSIPWSKPEPWQGQGPFGGMMQQGR